MGRFLATVVSGFLFVMFVCEAVSASSSEQVLPADRIVMFKATTVNHINYNGANGECRIKCDSHDLTGVFTMGMVDLRNGESQTWTKLLDESGPDFIHCEFMWTSMAKRIDYDIYTQDRIRIVPMISQWSVTEVGLFEQSPGGTYGLIIKWSG